MNRRTVTKKMGIHKTRHTYAYDKYRPENKHITASYDAVCKELGYEESVVREAVNHFMNWQHHSFSEAEYAEYLWPRFGVFKFFNRKDGKYYFPEVEEYENRKKLKDRNKDLEEPEKVSEEAQKLIDKIKDYPTVYIQQVDVRLKKFGWHIKGEVQEGGWNVLTMKHASIEELKELLKQLKELDKSKN